ncbi:hypothetical protein [Salinarimonas rosea]|uniref:hypothetical protein n=1 Tax=Salinarimonas rosea TaxID=552063 RepID=UPI00040F5112|nr:hypothetical protein [Salinarimonas rosea]
MARVARKRMTQTWREAVGAQAGPDWAAVLAAFDSAVESGTPEHVAAWEALAAHGRLDEVELPGDPSRSLAEAEEAQIAPDDPHDNQHGGAAPGADQNRSARNQ